MFNIAICDDDQIACQEIELLITKNRDRLSQQISIEVFESGESLYKAMHHDYEFDLIILDIEMQLLNGVEVGIKIREDLGNMTVQILYISAKQNYAMKLFDIMPLNFLVKPIDHQKMLYEVEKAISLSKRRDYYFEYMQNRIYKKISLKNILYFESHNKKITMVTLEREEEFYGKLDDIKSKLIDKGFISIHKSMFVNTLHITKYCPDTIVLFNNIELQISQSHRKELRRFLLHQ